MAVEMRCKGDVAEVVFERAGVLNALGPGDLGRLIAALDEASASGARVVVVRGAGGAFSSGDDLKKTAQLDAAEWAAVLDDFNELTRIARRAPMPFVCAIDGVCVGGAFEFACSCDLRIATSRSRFGLPEVRIGLTVTNGASFLLPQLCGVTFAQELMLSGRLIDAAEAHAHGIVNVVVPPDRLEAATAEATARIVSAAPLAVTRTKRLLVAAADDAVEAAMEREAAACAALFETNDLAEGLAAFREKREPRFGGS
jgi:enoyl-CoA hydratase/carnithine racemase